jgi:hypothetical protein
MTPFGQFNELSSSERTASRSSYQSTRHGSSVCSSERRSRCQSATGSDSRKTSNTAGTSSSITSSGPWSPLMMARSYSTRARLFATAASLHLEQGVAVTSHASQAKTVDQVIVSVPVRAFSRANEAQFYVSMSRAKWAMHVFTDSKVALRDAVTRPSKRLSSWELGTVVIAGPKVLDFYAGFCAHRATCLKADGKDIKVLNLILGGDSDGASGTDPSKV